MGAEIRGWLLYLLILAGIVYAGWNEPIRYRFIGRAKIAEEEAALFPAPVAQEKPEWRPFGTSLDRAPYQVRDGKLKYSKGYDRKELGVSTESAMRDYRERAQGDAKKAPAPE